MRALNLKTETRMPEPVSTTALVIAEQPSGCLIRTDDAQFIARRAVSCLVRPVVGDTVLVFIDNKGQAYILSILERLDTGATRLSVDNDLVIESTADSIILAARESISLTSPGKASIHGGDVAITGRKGLFQLHQVEMVTDAATVHAKSGRLFANSIETVANTLTQRLQNCFRFVESLDQLKAGSLLQSVRKLMSLKTQQAVILAEQDVKIDGERIHMG
jgi:hypothetical protein